MCWCDPSLRAICCGHPNCHPNTNAASIIGLLKYGKENILETKKQMTEINKTLEERGSRYGDFTDHAAVAQALQNVMRNAYAPEKDGPAKATNLWDKLPDTQKQALTVIADKIARILTGDPNYADNWHDIQGYAKLVEDRLNK